MIDVNELVPGMQLKIVDAFTEHHYDECWVVSNMEQFLGQTVTVRGVEETSEYDDDDYVRSVFIEEDVGTGPENQDTYFWWHPDCFEYIVESEKIEDINESSISSLFE